MYLGAGVVYGPCAEHTQDEIRANNNNNNNRNCWLLFVLVLQQF